MTLARVVLVVTAVLPIAILLGLLVDWTMTALIVSAALALWTAFEGGRYRV